MGVKSKTKNCPVCGKIFKCTTGCGCCYFDNQWEYDYCSYNCWINSDEFLDNKKLVINFFKSLSAEYRDAFLKIKDIVEDDDYNIPVDNWLNEIKEA